MKKHLNTLFVTTQGAYLRREGGAVTVIVEKETRLRIPLHNLDGIVGFGRVSYSPYLLASCAETGVSVSMMTEHGRFLASLNGFQRGNVLLRREQYRRADDESASLVVARSCVQAKCANARGVVLRAARDHGDDGEGLASAAKRMVGLMQACSKAQSVDSIRGLEGEAASVYFSVFERLVTLTGTDERAAFKMAGRTRRPPLDRANAMLSFVYTLLMNDCRSAAEGAGLDSQVGFLHRDRPGRPSLALDLMEEFRPILADRTVLSLINRRQVQAKDFEPRENRGIYLNEKARKRVLATWQKRKQSIVRHPFLDERVSVGFLPHLQARLLARHLRGDLDGYPAMIWG